MLSFFPLHWAQEGRKSPLVYKRDMIYGSIIAKFFRQSFGHRSLLYSDFDRGALSASFDVPPGPPPKISTNASSNRGAILSIVIFLEVPLFLAKQCANPPWITPSITFLFCNTSNSNFRRSSSISVDKCFPSHLFRYSLGSPL